MRRFDFGRRQLGMARSSRATNCWSPSRPKLVAEGQVTCELIVSVSPCPPLAHSGRDGRRQPRQLSGVKRTPRIKAVAAANDPKRMPSVRRSTAEPFEVYGFSRLTSEGDA